MSQETYKPITRTKYLVASEDGSGQPYLADAYEGQEICGYLLQECIDMTDWLSYLLVLDLDWAGDVRAINELQDTPIEVRFIRNELIKKRAERSRKI